MRVIPGNVTEFKQTIPGAGRVHSEVVLKGQRLQGKIINRKERKRGSGLVVVI